jgi:hypothetical protein
VWRVVVVEVRREVGRYSYWLPMVSFPLTYLRLEGKLILCLGQNRTYVVWVFMVSGLISAR